MTPSNSNSAAETPVWATQIAAQAWCDPMTSDIEMDPRLAAVFARSLAKLADEYDKDRAAQLADLTRERDAACARIDRAVKAAEEVFGEDAVRYKLCLRDDGRATNHFPVHMDGGWFAFQRAEDDAHVGLCDEIVRLRAELAALKNAAQAVVQRWDTPLWKDAPATATFINSLRAALGGEASTQALRVPAGWKIERDTCTDGSTCLTIREPGGWGHSIYETEPSTRILFSLLDKLSAAPTPAEKEDQS